MFLDFLQQLNLLQFSFFNKNCIGFKIKYESCEMILANFITNQQSIINGWSELYCSEIFWTKTLDLLWIKKNHN